MPKYKRFEATTKVQFVVTSEADEEAVIKMLRSGMNKLNKELVKIDPTAVIDFNTQKVKIKELPF